MELSVLIYVYLMGFDTRCQVEFVCLLISYISRPLNYFSLLLGKLSLSDILHKLHPAHTHYGLVILR